MLLKILFSVLFVLAGIFAIIFGVKIANNQILIGKQKTFKELCEDEKYKDIQPYDNSAFLELVGAVKRYIETKEPIPDDVFDNWCKESVANHKKQLVNTFGPRREKE